MVEEAIRIEKQHDQEAAHLRLNVPVEMVLVCSGHGGVSPFALRFPGV